MKEKNEILTLLHYQDTNILNFKDRIDIQHMHLTIEEERHNFVFEDGVAGLVQETISYAKNAGNILTCVFIN